MKPKATLPAVVRVALDPLIFKSPCKVAARLFVMSFFRKVDHKLGISGEWVPGASDGQSASRMTACD